ncbi:DUF262 domain-containing protein [Tenacibaculum dicentrarchi]|uniref:DUF262 domain-containing protein n=1 Tax=Tenacibaculum dicentrarchi TaxID=669041 RepID=UPI0035141DBE
MESNLLSISKIFTERLFRIPDYQRGYAWTEKQLKDFWNDLQQLEENKNHYTGVLTLENVPDEILKEWEDDLWIIKHKSYHPYYIVDGQQRLTTSIILIQCIIEVSEKLCDSLNFTSLTDIKKKFIYDTKDNGISRSYIFGYEKDNPSYEFLKTEIFTENSETSNQKQETIYTQNLENAKIFFISQLKDLSKDVIETLYRKLTQQFLFNIYTITSDIDTFVSFETMNNRGKPLSHLELLKNRLIYLSTKLTDDSFEKNSLRKRINECWKSIYHNLGRNKLNPLDDDKFLVNHFMIYFGNELWSKEDIMENTRIRLPHFYAYQRDDYANYLLEKKFTTKNVKDSKLSIREIDDYVRSLQGSVEIWYQIHNPKQSDFSLDIKKWLDKINRLGVENLAPLIMTFFRIEKNNDVRLSLLIELEKLMFTTILMRLRYYFLESEDLQFLTLAVRLNDKKITPSEILKKIEDARTKFIGMKEAKELMIKEFKDKGFYKWSGMRYFLFEYDLNLAEESKTNRKKLLWEEFNNEDYSTVEHIYPQNSRSKCWTENFKQFSSKERKTIKNSLGNLLPLSRNKNSSFQNKCFIDKISNSKNTIGFKYGCYAENEITDFKEWTSKEILERGMHLLDFMEDRWKIKLGNENDKIRLLGLQFLKKTPANKVYKK